MKNENTLTIKISFKLASELFALINKEPPESIGEEEISSLVNELKRRKVFERTETKINCSKKEKLKSILIIDDMGTVIYQLELLLSRYNYDISLARTKEEALTVLHEKKHFDIILQDLCLPDKQTGLDLLRELRQYIMANQLNSHIIAMSVLDDPKIIQEVLETGADNFINKDINWKSELAYKLSNL